MILINRYIKNDNKKAIRETIGNLIPSIIIGINPNVKSKIDIIIK